MKHNRYSLVSTVRYGVSVYGIEIVTENNATYHYSYISAFAQEADELIRRMSQDYISPIHFNDIVTDYLERLNREKFSENHLK